MIHAGIIGYGTMGRVHSEALRKLAGVELTVVADPDADRRHKAQGDLGVEVVASAEQLLQYDPLDLVSICTPTYLHASVFQQAVRAQKHIFTEKPLASTLEEGQQIYNLVQNYNRQVGVAHVVRFFPEYAQIRERVLQGEIGEATVARTFRGGSLFPAGWQDWYHDYDLSGGVILDLMIHDLDYLRWLFGDVQRVYAKTTHKRTTSRLEHAMIIVRFKNGVLAHVEGSWANVAGTFYTTVEISGKQGLISYDSRQAALNLKSAKGKGEPRAVSVPENPLAESPYLLELADMVAAIRENRPPAVSVKEALASLEVALAAIKSAATGEVITF